VHIICTSASFQSKQLSLLGIYNAIFDEIYSNKNQKTSTVGFFCFEAQKHRFSLIFALIVIKISNHRIDGNY